MDPIGEPRNDRRCEAVRGLLAVLAHVRRVVASFPGESRLRSACVLDLRAALASVDPARPLVLELVEQDVLLSGALVHHEPFDRPFWRLLTSSGATGLLLAPPISPESLVRYVEVLLEAADGGAERDPIAELRAAELGGIETLFGRSSAGDQKGRAGSSDQQKALLSAGPTRALPAAEHQRVRAALEQELQKNRPLLGATAIATALASDPPTVPTETAFALLVRLIEMLLAGHDLRTAAAVLEEADRCAGREGVALLRLEAPFLRAAEGRAWLEHALLVAKREDLQALGVLVLRIDGFLPRILGGVELEHEPQLARELELFARLDPSAFAACAESVDPRLRAASRQVLARAGH